MGSQRSYEDDLTRQEYGGHGQGQVMRGTAVEFFVLTELVLFLAGD